MSEISVNIRRVTDEILPTAVLTALNDACQLIENSAVDNCPVDDGQLMASVTHTTKQEGSAFTGSVGSNSEHAPYVHEGTGLYAKDGNGRQNVPWVYCDAKGEYHSTKGQKPNQFLQKAVDDNMGDILKSFEGCLKE